MQDFLGYLAGTCTTIAFVPQVLRTVRTRDTSGIDIRMFLIFATGVLLWLVFGITTGSRPVIVFNAITLALVGLQIAVMLRLRRRPAGSTLHSAPPPRLEVQGGG